MDTYTNVNHTERKDREEWGELQGKDPLYIFFYSFHAFETQDWLLLACGHKACDAIKAVTKQSVYPPLWTSSWEWRKISPDDLTLETFIYSSNEVQSPDGEMLASQELGFMEVAFQKHYLHGSACQLGEVTQNSRYFRPNGVPSKFQAEWQGGFEGDPKSNKCWFVELILICHTFQTTSISEAQPICSPACKSAQGRWGCGSELSSMSSTCSHHTPRSSPSLATHCWNHVCPSEKSCDFLWVSLLSVAAVLLPRFPASFRFKWLIFFKPFQNIPLGVHKNGSLFMFIFHWFMWHLI